MIDRIKSLISYDPQTGVFTWAKSRRGCRVGDVCGNTSVYGYNRITLDGKSYRAARLAYAIMVGHFPRGFIDHKNGNRADDRWDNLRECTPQQNAINSAPRGVVKGVSWDSSRGKWLAQARINGKKKNLGRHECFGSAVNAHRSACKSAHGDFYRAI